MCSLCLREPITFPTRQTKCKPPIVARGRVMRGRRGKPFRLGGRNPMRAFKPAKTPANTKQAATNFTGTVATTKGTNSPGGLVANIPLTPPPSPAITSPVTPNSPLKKSPFKRTIKNPFGKRRKKHILPGRSPMARLKGSPFSPRLSPNATFSPGASPTMSPGQSAFLQLPQQIQTVSPTDRWMAQENVYYEEDEEDEDLYENEFDQQIVPAMAEDLYEHLNILPPPEEIIDTNDMEMPQGSCKMSPDCRKALEWILLALNLLVLALPIWSMISLTSEVNSLLDPFNRIFSTTEEPGNATFISYWLYSLDALYICFIIYRLFVMLHVLQMEDDDYQSRPSSVSILLLHVCNYAMVVVITIVIYITSRQQLLPMAENFPVYFGAAQERYLSDPDTKSQLDQMQIEFGCCGSRGIESWDNTNLLESWTKFKEDFQDYWDKLRECANEDKPKDTNLFKEAHTPEFTNKAGRILSVPFSCCNPEYDKVCNYYNYKNTNSFWKEGVEYKQALYNQGCSKTVIPRLIEMEILLEGHFTIRLVLEVIFILITYYIKESFSSHYERHQRPSVVEFPCWSATGLIFFMVVMYLWINNVFEVGRFVAMFSSSSTKDGILQKIADELISSMTTKTTTTPKQ